MMRLPALVGSIFGLVSCLAAHASDLPPSLKVTVNSAFQDRRSAVSFLVDIRDPKRNLNAFKAQFEVKAYFPDLKTPATLAAGSIPGTFSFTTSSFSLNQRNELTVQVVRTHGPNQGVVAEQRVPLEFLESSGFPSQHTVQWNSAGKLNVSVLAPAILRTGKSLVRINADVPPLALELVTFKNGKVIDRRIAFAGKNQYALMLTDLAPSVANTVRLELRGIDLLRPITGPSLSPLAAVDAQVRVLDDAIADARYPTLTASSLAKLFGKSYVPGTDPNAFLNSWHVAGIRSLASIFLQTQGYSGDPNSAPVPYQGMSDSVVPLNTNCKATKDLAFIDPDNATGITILPSVNDSSFGTPQFISTGAELSALAVGDVNHDGRADLVAVSKVTGLAYVVLASKTCGKWNSVSTFPAGSSPISIAINDVNQDNNSDLVIGDHGDRSLAVLLGDGHGGFAAPAFTSIPIDPRKLFPQTPAGGKTGGVQIGGFSGGPVLWFQPNSGGGYKSSPVASVPTSRVPMTWGGDGFVGELLPELRDPAGAGCSEVQSLLNNPVVGSLPGTSTANPVDLGNLIGETGGANTVVLSFAVGCLNLSVKLPPVDCQTGRDVFSKLFGETPEDVIWDVAASLGVPDKFIELGRPRLNVCTGVDTSGLTCKDAIALGEALATLIVPGLGFLLDNPIANFVLGAVLCMDLHFPNIPWPNLPSISISMPPIGFSWGSFDGFGCFMFCGGNSGDNSSQNAFGFSRWFGESSPQVSGGGLQWLNNGIAGLGDVSPDCSIVPSSFLSLKVSDLEAIATAKNVSLTKVINSLVACRFPRPIPGFKDLNPPTVLIDSPSDGASVSGQMVTVTGRVSDFAAVVTVNGTAASMVALASGGQYSAVVPLPSNGQIVVQAADAAGNVAQSLVNVTTTQQGGWTAINAGFRTACGILNGVLNCWGGGLQSILGDQSLTNVSKFASSQESTCAIVNGSLLCFGGNSYTVLGDPSYGGSHAQLRPGLPAGITDVVAGNYFFCTLIQGAVYCFGDNTSGQSGSSSGNPDVIAPNLVPGLETGVTSISARWNRACAVVSGAVKCWGDNNDQGPLLGSAAGSFSSTPITIPGLESGVQTVAVGEQHICALMIDQTVMCYGASNVGQVGPNADLSQGSVSPAVKVDGLATGIQKLVAGDSITCALNSAGIQCWGGNSWGQIGIGTVTDSEPIPQTVLLPNGRVSDVTASGRSSACAIVVGYAYCWGANQDGQLGNTSLGYFGSSVPILVTDPTSISQVHAPAE